MALVTQVIILRNSSKLIYTDLLRNMAIKVYTNPINYKVLAFKIWDLKACCHSNGDQKK